MGLIFGIHRGNNTIFNASSTLIRFQANGKRSCFALDMAIVHTTTPETITKIGAIRKRSPEQRDLKTMLLENAVF